MGPQYVYTMKGLRKVYSPDRVVLNDIWPVFPPRGQDRGAWVERRR